MVLRAGTARSPDSGPASPSRGPVAGTRLRMALNLLTDDPSQPSGAHWCWTWIVPAMANRLLPGEELHLMLSPSARTISPTTGMAFVASPSPGRTSIGSCGQRASTWSRLFGFRFVISIC